MNNRNNRGLSMLEMVMAMTVLFLVGAFVMNMFVQGSRQMAKAANREKLTSLARAKVSEMRLMDYVDLDGATLSGSFPAPDDGFQYQVSYSDFQGYPQTEARTVTIAVSHPTHGRTVTRIVRSNVPPLDPGQVAFNKFGCATCHSLPAAGYPAAAGLVPLDQVGQIGDAPPGWPNPSAADFENYVTTSISDPTAFDPFPTGSGSPYEALTMTDYKYQGVDPDYDPAVDVSIQEGTDMAVWLRGLQQP